MSVSLTNVPITPIPDTKPEAVPALWNVRYAQIDKNFDDLRSYLSSLVTVPVGAVFHFAGSAPSGYLTCDASISGPVIPFATALGQSTFQGIDSFLLQGLRTYLGTRHGADAGTIPDMRDDFIRAASTTRPVGTRETSKVGDHRHFNAVHTGGNDFNFETILFEQYF